MSDSETATFVYKGMSEAAQKAYLKARAKEAQDGLDYRNGKPKDKRGPAKQARGGNGRVTRVEPDQVDAYLEDRAAEAAKHVKDADACREVQGTKFPKGKPVTIARTKYAGGPDSHLYKKLCALCQGGEFEELKSKEAPKAPAAPAGK